MSMNVGIGIGVAKGQAQLVSYGPNLYTGQTFSAATGVTETATHLEFTGASVGFHPRISVALVASTYYLMEFSVENWSAGTLDFAVGNTSGSISTGAFAGSSTGSFNGLVQYDPADIDAKRIRFGTSDFVGDVILSTVSARAQG